MRSSLFLGLTASAGLAGTSGDRETSPGLLKPVRALALAIGAMAATFAFPALAQNQDGWSVNIDNSHFTPMPAGGQADYRVTIDHSGNAATAPTTIVFTIPQDTIYNGITGLSGCTPDVEAVPSPTTAPVAIACDLPAILPGAEVEAVVDLRHMVEGVAILEASIDSYSTRRRTTVQKGADLAIALSADPTSVQAGDMVTFTATVTNEGPYDSTGGEVVLTLPPGVSRAFTPPEGCSITGDTIACTLANLPAGESVSLDFVTQATAETESNVTIAGAVSGASPRDPQSGNNTATATLDISEGMDVSLRKTRAPLGLLFIDTPVTFTLEPRVAGRLPLSARITDTVPANYVIEGVDAGEGWTCGIAGDLVTCDYDGTAAGADYLSPTVIRARAVATTGPEGVTNVAGISAEGENSSDAAAGNNSANDGVAHIAEPVVDLVAHKSGPERGLVTVGNTYQFRLWGENDGEHTNVAFSDRMTITDILGDGLTITGYTAPAGWTCETALPLVGPGLFSCTTDKYVDNPLPIGARSDVIVLDVLVTKKGTLRNGVEVAFPDYETEDGNPADNIADLSGGLISADFQNWADVSVVKSILSPGSTLAAHDEITFRIEVFNSGPAEARDVRLVDVFEDIVAAGGGAPGPLGDNPSNGFVCPRDEVSGAYSRTLECRIDALPQCLNEPGHSCPYVDVTVRVGDVGAKANTATAYSYLTPDNNTSNNVSEVEYTVTPLTDVSVVKESTATSTGAAVGQEITYVITVQVPDLGLSPAEDVRLEDTLPHGVRFVRATPKGAGVTCDVHPLPGSLVSSGNDTIECALGTIASRGQQSIEVVVLPTLPLLGQDIVNTATVTTATPEIPNDRPNTDQATVEILAPSHDLEVQKRDSPTVLGMVGPDPVQLNTDMVYRITVTNSGPSDATAVQVTDFLPVAGLANARVIAPVPDGWTCTPDENVSPAVPGGNIVCEADLLPSGTSVDLLIQMTAVEHKRASNRVTISSAETRANPAYDPVPDNNESEEDTAVRVLADVSVTKTASKDVVDLREQFYWELVIAARSDLGVAEGVVLTDDLPAGMVLADRPEIVGGPGAGQSCFGEEGDTSVSCALGDIQAGDSVTVRLPVRILSVPSAGATVENEARVTTLSFDADASNDFDSDEVQTVLASTISGTIYRDFNDDGEQSSHDSGIEGVRVTVTGVSLYDGETITAWVDTGSDGSYTVGDLPPGTYTVSYGPVNEAHLNPGQAIPGTDATGAEAGTIDNQQTISGIEITTAIGATDYDFTLVPQARIGLGKVASQPSLHEDGSYSITYTLTVENFSLEPVREIVVRDLIDEADRNFGRYVDSTPGEGEYTITGLAGGAFGSRDNGFTGEQNNDVLVSAGVLAAQATGSVEYTVRVNPEMPRLQGLTHVNQASITGLGEFSGQTPNDLSNNTSDPDPDGNGNANEPANNTPTTVTPSFTPAIAIEKTARLVPAGADAEVNDRIEYTFEVTNTGQTPLVNVTVSDPLPGLSGITGPAAPVRLERGESATFTATYTLGQDDLDLDAVSNTATASGQWGQTDAGTPLNVTSTDTATVEALAAPGLEIVKDIVSTTIGTPRSEVGEEIRYRFIVTNTGNTNLRDVRVVDPMLGAIPELAIGDLDRGANKEVFATYRIDQDDIDAGVVDNVAYATGAYGSPSAPKIVESDEDTESANVYRQPAVSLVKTIVPTSIPAIPRAGNVLEWRVTATNTGNVTLTGLELSDPIASEISTLDPAFRLLPGESVDFTVRGPIAQSHINAGQIDNTATLDFRSPSGDEPPVSADETAPLPQSPQIELTKLMTTTVTEPMAPGDTLRYRFLIRNTGNVPLTGITLDDDLGDFAFDAGVEAQLLATVLQPQNAGETVPPADTQISVEGTLTLSQSDIDAGEVLNTALVRGVYTDGPTPLSATDTDEVRTSLDRDPQIRLIKTVTSAPAAHAVVGDVITYAFAIHNVGNVVLEDIRLVEALQGALIENPTGWSGPLLPGAIVDDVFTASYELRQEDINRGHVENSATVTGTGLGVGGVPTDVSDVSGTTVDDDQPIRVPLQTRTGLTIVKSAVETLSTPPVAGDTIAYSFVVTNTGNLTLYDVEISDPLLSATALHTIPVLEPGEGNAVTFGPLTYSVRQDDIQAGQIVNTARADGTYRDPLTQTDLPISALSNQIVIPLDQEPGLAVVKEATANLSDPTVVGEQIEYRFYVHNTGNIVIDDVRIEDPLPGLPQSVFPVGLLNPGEMVVVGPVAYAVTQDDIDRGAVINQATARGIYDVGGGPEPISDLSGPTVTTDEETIVPVIPVTPSLEIVKQARYVGNGTSYALVGDRIEFTFEITNTGNVPLSDVRPEELTFLFGGVPAETPVTDFVPASVTLQRGESQVFTASYEVTQADLNAGAGVADGVSNTAEAVGVASGNLPVRSAPDTARLTLNPQPPSDISIAKTTTRPVIHRGETVPFVIEVRNNSLSNAGRISVIDRLPSGFAFVEGSATVDGVAATPVVEGNALRFDDLPLGPLARIEIRLVMRALPATPPGRYRNTALGIDELGKPLGPDVYAYVEIAPDAVFDCTDIIGTVFDDRNGNRYQDEGEPGIPGVRLSTVRGTLVTTDAFGRFSIPCAAIPDANIGSNFVLKVDAATLPTGFGLTTDNPAMVRITPGKMAEINFGAQIGRQIRLTLADDAFVAGTTAPTPGLDAGIGQLISVLVEQEARLQIVYGTAADRHLARARLDVLSGFIRERWNAAGSPYTLVIDTMIEER